MKTLFHSLIPMMILGISMQSCDQKTDKDADKDVDKNVKNEYFLHSKKEETKKGKERTIKQLAPVKVQHHLLDSTDELKTRFFGEELTLVIQKRIHKDSHNTYSGIVKGDKQSSVLFILKDDIIKGSIQTSTTKYEINHTAKKSIISEINYTGFPEDDDGVEIKPENLRDTIIYQPDGCNEIDVLVLYTEDAKDSEGGQSDIESRIELAFLETNTSYQNSGVTHEINNAGMEEIDFDDPKSSSSSLNWLSSNNDVEQLRDQHNADIVIMITDDFSNASCGRAYIQSDIDPSFESKAFGVVKRSCMTGNYSFGHEIGHIMGCRHNCETDDTDTPFKYSHGYSFCPDDGASWRTIMSYRECSNPRILFWSNPNNTRNGNAMGNSSGDCQSNNVKTLNKSASTVANFRNSQRCNITFCDRFPVFCDLRYDPPELINPPKPIFNFPRGGALEINEICKYVLDCPGCRDGVRLCPGYNFRIKGLRKEVVLKIINGKGEVIAENNSPEAIRTINTGEISSDQHYFLLLLNKEDKLLEKPVRATIEVVNKDI